MAIPNFNGSKMPDMPMDGGKTRPDPTNPDIVVEPEPHSESAEPIAVPISTLGMPDEAEQMTPPEVGDVVNFQVTGKVKAIEGDNAMVAMTSINGKDIPNSPTDPSEEDNQASLEEEARGIGNLS